MKDRIKLALDEARMLTLGAEILVGAAYRAIFQDGYDRLPVLHKAVHAGAITLTLLVLILLMLPGPFHQISERGQDTLRLRDFASRMMELSLLPFALALGTCLFSFTYYALDTLASAGLAIVGTAAALFLWYGLGFWGRRRLHREERIEHMRQPSPEQPTSVKDKIAQLLTEGRVILPGAQAVLGFQFLAMLSDSFSKLPDLSRVIHIASLCSIGLATMLLMTPAAYHRIVENGEFTASFERIAGRLILAAMVPLAAGLAGDFYVVLQKATASAAIAAVGGALMLTAYLGAWFGFTLYARRRRGHTARLDLARA